jgi:membrane-bound lytic murein transglycosylase A
VWLDTTLPDETQPYRRLVFAQDTGGAIKGAARADLFFGQGEDAERLAGKMKQAGRLYVLLPARRDLALNPARPIASK